MAHTAKTAVAAAILLIWIAGAASAHPHVFVYNHLTVVFDDMGLAGFDIRWTFDEMFSQMFIGDYDKNRNGDLEPMEIDQLKAGAFDNLKEFGYFTHIRVNGQPFAVRFVKNFRAEINKNKLIYRFFVPCHVQALETAKAVTIAIYDQTFYCSVFLVKDPVSFKNPAPYEVDHRIAINKEEAYYFEQIYPEEITLTFRRRT